MSILMSVSLAADLDVHPIGSDDQTHTVGLMIGSVVTILAHQVLVERSGIEPLTPCLQSRCSPS